MSVTLKPITVISLIFGLFLLIGSTIFLFQGNPREQSQKTTIRNVDVIEGKQVVRIQAKGGYQPRRSIAKADIATIVRFDTNGTFDCSSSVRIPSLNISKNLLPSGSTDIELGVVKAGVLQGSCGMGMYPFEIDFQG